ncbi:MAG: hypothetical protein KY457_05505 [Actinobacteria bacterium]|nr:hypothetical protein [Actinomycetota bacterium]
MKLRALVLAGSLTGVLAAAPAPTPVDLAPTAAADEGVGSDNVRHVANLPHVNAQGEDPGADGGSDIEFFTISYERNDYADRFLRGRSTPGGLKQQDLNGDVADGIQRRYALAGTVGNGMHIYDITSPEDTFRVTRYDCPANQGDSQIFTRDEDGVTRTYATYTTEDTRPVSGDTVCGQDVGAEPSAKLIGTFIVDISDPYAPRAVGFIKVPEGSHNGTVHPSGEYFYNSNSSLYNNTVRDGGPGIEYYDISDVTAPVRLGRLPLKPIPASLGTESHDITFNADGTRAYSAALSQGVILDTSNPAKPSIITQWVDPTIQVWHQADPIQVGDRTLLVVEDEVAGALPTGQCPNGGVHVFDVTGDPAVPEKIGYWNIDEVRVMAADGSPPASTCTAHVFRLYPEQGIMTIAYYNGGVRVVDLAGLAGIGLGEDAVTGDDPMVQLGYHRFADSDAWSVKTPEIAEDGSFYMFSNDLERGLDVYHFTAEEDAEARTHGRWMSAAEAAAVLTPVSAAQLQAADGFSCLLP